MPPSSNPSSMSAEFIPVTPPAHPPPMNIPTSLSQHQASSQMPPNPLASAHLSPPVANYLPQFPFSRPPFLPYDFASTIQRNLSHHHQMQRHGQTAGDMMATNNIPPISTSTAEHLSSAHLSPASSRPSSSSPRSSHSVPHHHHTMHSSIEITSTHDHSSSDSEDEHIDVVKSAFVPILSRALASHQQSLATTLNRQHQQHQQHLLQTGHKTPPPSTTDSADTTIDETLPQLPSPIQRQVRINLKAPSSRKNIQHDSAPRIGSPSETTKLVSPTISQQKTVWRPY